MPQEKNDKLNNSGWSDVLVNRDLCLENKKYI